MSIGKIKWFAGDYWRARSFGCVFFLPLKTQGEYQEGAKGFFLSKDFFNDTELHGGGTEIHGGVFYSNSKVFLKVTLSSNLEVRDK